MASDIYQSGQKLYYQKPGASDFTYITSPSELQQLAKSGAVKVGSQYKPLPQQPTATVPPPSDIHNGMTIDQANQPQNFNKSGQFIGLQPAPQVAPTQPSQQPQPTQGAATPTNQPPQQGSQMAFQSAFQQLMQKAQYNQGLQDQETLLRRARFDRDLTDQDILQLPPAMQEAVRNRDNAMLDFQISSLRDQIKGRATDQTQALQYMVNGYQQDRQALEAKQAKAFGSFTAMLDKYPQLYQAMSQEGLQAVLNGDMPPPADVVAIANAYANVSQNDTTLLTPTEAANLNVPYGTTRAQAAAMGVVPKSILTGKDKIDKEIALHKDYQTMAKDLNRVKENSGIMDSAVKEATTRVGKGESINAASQAVINAFNKLLDSNSVVREGEYDRAGVGQSIRDRIEGLYQQLQSGGAGVTLDTIKEFASLTNDIVNNYRSVLGDTIGVIKNQADAYGLDINNIIPAGELKLYEDNQKSTAAFNQDDYDYILQTHGQAAADAYRANPQSFSNVGSDTKKVTAAIGQYESGGNYKAVGKTTASGDKAYGKYQVMGANIPSWTKEVLGKSMTPAQFLADADAQDKVAEYKLGKYLAQYGTVEDAASMWFSGKPAAKAGDAKDVVGTTVPKYIAAVKSIYNKLA